ncbi:DUF2716 domain-containing protein [Allokutzneria multivorans]|uniref:DUF2716 domain-containing protein n=1 Tax=Allokutzneria multivorans TaxID=1142134 RepID=A0ABP7QTP9_9PSEU
MDKASALLAAYDEQVRGHLPERAPMGAVIERDGPAIRTHYGTHGTVRHSPAPDLIGLISRQQEAFAARHEPVEWRAYSHDAIPLDAALRAAGFTEGAPARTLLIAELDDLTTEVAPAKRMRVRRLDHGYHRLRELNSVAETSGPHTRALPEIREDHGNLLSWSLNVQLLESEAKLVGAGWAEAVGSTEFVAVRGMTGPHPEFVPAWVRWARNRRSVHVGTGLAPDRRYFTAEAPTGPVLDALLAVGFRAVSTVRTYSWTPINAVPASTRPVSMLLDDPDHDALGEEFEARFAFKPSYTYYPGIDEPADSITWHVADVAKAHARVQDIVERGLRARVRPGEDVHSVRWWRQGYRFDPARVGGPGQPGWPGTACWEGDYYKLLTRDLRMGTFWHPWEESLCVFGAELLAEVEDELTAALGTVMRRGGHNVGNVWTYESPGDR